MVGWQRHLNSIVRLVGNAAKQRLTARANYSSACSSPFLLGQICVQQRTLALSSNFTPHPLYYHLHEQWSCLLLKGISTSRRLLADSSSDANVTPVASPLIPVSTPNSDHTENQTVVAKRSKVQAVRKGIKQSAKKVNLVATLVRGMRVEDALLQLQVTIKRASKTVYQVIHSARANATHNHGLDPDRLLVAIKSPIYFAVSGDNIPRVSAARAQESTAEAYVGKGFCKKRISYHSKGRSGIKVRPECRLTVVVREIIPEEEAEIAKLKVAKFKKLTKWERRLVPHKLIETTPIWGRRRKLREDSA